ncbi:transposase [Roseateles koreensis]|uniref:Transposase n=1 Tax=Roseateles koreensis TaxID=2987526 RepID=A0ABT5KRK3_9BURK|nr:transposase [Roseateles koreensis]MDC8785487.1 transposase [Roseateles koreensis]
MARPPRLILADQAHHVIQRGNNRQVIVQSDADRQQFMDMLRDSAATHKVAIHAYVLMDNHLHLLATPADAQGISRLMQSLGRRYVGWYNFKYQRTGTLWEGRFRASLIESEAYFMACLRYIELNPARAGICSRPEDFKWSSCAAHLGQRSDTTLSDHALFWSLGNTPFEREHAYRAFLEQGVSEDERKRLTESVLKGAPLCSAVFLKELTPQALESMQPKPRGRPRGTVKKFKKIDSDPI